MTAELVIFPGVIYRPPPAATLIEAARAVVISSVEGGMAAPLPEGWTAVAATRLDALALAIQRTDRLTGSL